MKKLQVSFLLVFLASFTAFANDSDLFKFDYDAVQTQFTQLNQLGDMVTANTDLTYSVLDGNLISSLNLLPGGSLPGSATSGPVAGIPSFLWGCVLGPVGLAIVYIASDKDSVETKKAMWGCITGVGVEVVVYVIYWFAVVHTVTHTI